jgi:hypothetical protein
MCPLFFPVTQVFEVKPGQNLKSSNQGIREHVFDGSAIGQIDIVFVVAQKKNLLTMQRG